MQKKLRTKGDQNHKSSRHVSTAQVYLSPDVGLSIKSGPRKLQTTDGPNLVYTAKHGQRDVSLENSISSLNSTDSSFDVDPDDGDFLCLRHLGLRKMRPASLERRNVENQVRLDNKILTVEAVVRHDSLACRN